MMLSCLGMITACSLLSTQIEEYGCGARARELKDRQFRTITLFLDGIKQTIANSPYTENAQAEYLNFVEKYQTEYLGKPFDEITDPDELSPIQSARAQIKTIQIKITESIR
jgi:hypothetical protein